MILFVIGNGFDIGNGMKTGYRQFYHFLKSNHKEFFNSVASLFLAEFETDRLWCEFEECLSAFSPEYFIDNELTPQETSEIVLDFQELLSGYFKEWSQMEEDDSYQYDQGTECLTFKGIDIYLEPARITKLIRQKYDCMVYDYGCYYDPTFERASFFEKDIACLVGGSKVNEYTATNEALLDNMDRENMYYLFSFTSGQDAKEIMSNMKKLADHTMFPAYTPDMFVYSPDNNYERFFKYKLQVDKQAEKKKGIFQIFNRKKVGE